MLAAAASGSAAALRTGTDSPVSADSSTERFDAVHQHAVRRHPVALGEQDDVTAHDVASGDAYLLPVAHDERRGEERSRSAASAFSVLCSW